MVADLREIIDEIGKEIKDLIDWTESVDIGSAYFSPEKEVIEKINNVDNVRILVSDEYPPTNPKKLKKIEDGKIKEYPNRIGKFHSKVMIFSNGKDKKCIIGSANLTYSGLNNNREACILLDSKNDTDKKIIENLQDYFDDLFDSDESEEINFDTAVKQFENRERRRTESIEEDFNFWTLKTRSKTEETDHWDNFVNENVLAIGFTVNNVDDNTSIGEIKDQIERQTDKPKGPAKVERFAEEVEKGDRVLIMSGYVPNQEADVFIYGMAVIEGEFKVEPESNWWKFKRNANIQKIEEKVPKDELANILDKGSLREAIHGGFSMKKYSEICKMLRDRLGVTIEID